MDRPTSPLRQAGRRVGSAVTGNRRGDFREVGLLTKTTTNTDKSSSSQERLISLSPKTIIIHQIGIECVQLSQHFPSMHNATCCYYTLQSS